MKKNFVSCLSAFLAAVLLASVFCGCNRSAPAEPEETTPPEEQTTAEPTPEEPRGSLELISHGKTDYRVVYAPGSGSEEVKCALKIVSELNKIFKLNVSVGYATEKGYDPDAPEIVLGSTDYPESGRFLEELKFTGFGVRQEGNKIIVGGYTVEALQSAVAAFLKQIKRSIYQEEDGTVSVFLDPAEFPKSRLPNRMEQIPEPEQGTLTSVTDGDLNLYTLCYSDVTLQNYLDYCTQLEAGGYTKHQENKIGENKFATYLSDGGMLALSYFTGDRELRIVADPLRSTAVYTEPESAGPKVTENTLGIFTLDYTNRILTDAGGMCYIITLEDGSYVILDGGYEWDAARLWKYLQDNNQRTDGVHIAGWFISHLHNDHAGCFRKFSQEYANQVTLSYVFANPAASTVYTADAEGSHSWASLTGEVGRFIGAKLVAPHTGQRFRFGTVEFEVWYTHEDMYPNQLVDENDTSTVLKMYANGKTALFTGDAVSRSEIVMIRHYGNLLSSDIFQVPHHGVGGATWEFMSLINPDILLYTTNNESFAIRSAESYTVPNYALIQNVLKKGGAVYVADGPCKLLPLNDPSPENIMEYNF